MKISQNLTELLRDKFSYQNFYSVKNVDGVAVLVLCTSHDVLYICIKFHENQPLQLCTARTLFPIVVTVRLYTVISEVCRCRQ